jgi:hypothetical protein
VTRELSELPVWPQGPFVLSELLVFLMLAREPEGGELGAEGAQGVELCRGLTSQATLGGSRRINRHLLVLPCRFQDPRTGPLVEMGELVVMEEGCGLFFCSCSYPESCAQRTVEGEGFMYFVVGSDRVPLTGFLLSFS